MTSVLAHSELEYVVMEVETLKVEGITSLVRNSPKLIKLYYLLQISILDVEDFNLKMFLKREVFTGGLYKYGNISDDIQEN